MFSALVIAYLFLGGCGAGVLLTASLWSMIFHARYERSQRESEAFREYRDRCLFIGFVLVLVASVCLLADLGRPDRFLLLFLRPSPTSILTFGSFALALLLGASAFTVAANHLYLPRVSSRAKKVAEVVCVVLSLVVMTYTGFYLRSLYAVAFWDTLWLPVLFVLSSCSMGMSLCLIQGSFSGDYWLIGHALVRVRNLHIPVLLMEALSLMAFLFATAFGRGAAPDSCMLLFQEPLLAWFLGGVVVCGLLAPLVFGVAQLLTHSKKTLPVADLMCVFGGLALRFCLVSAGLH